MLKKLSKLNTAMLDMTVTFRDITGKDKETVRKEEFERLKKASDLGNDFLNYYNKNKIYFDKKSCELIEEIGDKFKKSHSTITFIKQMGFEPSKLISDRILEASKQVRKDIPPLIEELEDRLRDILEE